MNSIVLEKEFKKLFYKTNEFGQQSLGPFAKILQKKIPNNLEELRLEKIQISKNTLKELMKILIDENHL